MLVIMLIQINQDISKSLVSMMDSWNQVVLTLPSICPLFLMLVVLDHFQSFNKPGKWQLIKSLSFTSFCNFGCIDDPSRTLTSSGGSYNTLESLYLVHCEKGIRTVNDACARYSKNLIHIIIVWSSNCECTKLQIIKIIANLARWHRALLQV